MFTFTILFITYFSLTLIFFIVDSVIENYSFSRLVKGFSLISIICFISISFYYGVDSLLSMLVS
jgi:hypothetical protein